MNCCYILFSESLNRYYTGACHEDLESRLTKHNLHEYGDHRFTAKASDWRIVLVIKCHSYSQALKIEKHLKRMKSANYIQNLLKYPEIVEKLKTTYS